MGNKVWTTYTERELEKWAAGLRNAVEMAVNAESEWARSLVIRNVQGRKHGLAKAVKVHARETGQSVQTLRTVYGLDDPRIKEL